jgi:hypothetical protein
MSVVEGSLDPIMYLTSLKPDHSKINQICK